MLERASACLEPAARSFIRQLEPPIRSHRILGPSFWKHGGDELTIPVWWPLYLNSIRQVSQTPPSTRSANALQEKVTDGRRTSRKNRYSYLSSRYGKLHLDARLSPTRHFAKTSPGEQQPDNTDALSLAEESERSFEGENYLESLDTIPKLSKDYPTSTLEWPSHRTRRLPPAGSRSDADLESRLKHLIHGKEEKSHKFSEAWNYFIQLRDQNRMASQMLSFLSSSDWGIHLERALQVFDMISKEDRQKEDYELAIIVAMKSRKYSLANRINADAVAQGFGHDAAQVLLACCLAQGLWSNAAKVWQATFQYDDPSADKLEVSAFSRLPSPAKDSNPDLPSALLSLGERLVKKDPVLAQKDIILREMAQRLMLCAMLSTKVMGGITSKGLFRLFELYRQLDLETPKYHLSALRTLYSMRVKRNRTDLAAIVYRNLRFLYPNFVVKTWVYGGLISLATDANYSSNFFELLLDDFTSMHGRPDRPAYQRVLTALSRQGDIAGVQTQLQNFIKHHGNPQDEAYFNPAIYVYARIGDVTNARREFNGLKGYGIVPSVLSWNILIYAHSRSTSPETAFEIIEEMTAHGIRPDHYSIETLMGICSHSGDTQALYQLVELSKEYQIAGTNSMVENLVHSHCLNGEIETAQKLVETATEVKMDGPLQRMWNTLLKFYAFQANTSAVLSTQNRMKELGVEPDDMTCAALMVALVMVNKTKDAAKILRTLHFSAKLNATPFHYAIILHGYVREGNRDMASLVYKEMLQRYPRLSASAHYSMLRLQGKQIQRQTRHRDWDRGNAELPEKFPYESLAEALMKLSVQDMANKDPQPGFTRRQPREALPSIYVEYLVQIATESGNAEEAEEILGRYDALVGAEYLNLNERVRESMRLARSRMSIAIHQKRWEDADKYWRDILHRAIQVGSSKSLLQTQNQHRISGNGAEHVGRERENTPTKPSASIFPELGVTEPCILPACRFLLAYPLTLYMEALDIQDRHAELTELITQFESLGFHMTSRNCNKYVQTLTNSMKPEHQLLAFEIFENRLLENAIPWGSRYGSELQQQVDDEENILLKPKARGDNLRTKIRLGLLVPTYSTLMCLGRVFINCYDLALRGERTQFDLLRKQYSNTIKFLEGYPDIRRRIRSFSLKGTVRRKHRGGRLPGKAEVDRSLVLAGNSRMDDIPVEVLIDIESGSTAYDHTNEADNLDANESGRTLQDLELAERYFGQINRDPIVVKEENPLYKEQLQRPVRPKRREYPLRNRLEHPDEVAMRVEKEEKAYIEKIAQIRHQLRKEPLMSTSDTGEISFNAIERAEDLQPLAENVNLLKQITERAKQEECSLDYGESTKVAQEGH